MSATQITNHDAQARAVLLEEYKNSPVIQGILDTYCGDVQDLENALWSIKTGVNIFDAVGVQLDGLGQILATPRNGLSDNAYQGLLLAKIAQNVSKGTPEDVIKVYKLLMGATYVEYLETPSDLPGGFRISAIGASPITDNQSIKNAIQATRAAGTQVNFYATAPGVAFSFFGDPDPTGQGFEDSFDTTTGGYFVSIF